MLLARASLTNVYSKTNPQLSLSVLFILCFLHSTFHHLAYYMFTLFCFCLSPLHLDINSTREAFFFHCYNPSIQKVIGTVYMLNNYLLNEYMNETFDYKRTLYLLDDYNCLLSFYPKRLLTRMIQMLEIFKSYQFYNHVSEICLIPFLTQS